MPRTWFNIALLNFFLAGCIGALLRFAFVEEISWLKFTNFLHAHSHMAMLGWVYLALYALILQLFLPGKTHSPFYRRLFWFTQVTVIGMLVTFPIQGYALGSILFSSLHVILSYVFIYRFVKDTEDKKSISIRFIRFSLFFLVLSTLALWAMGLIIQQGLQGKAIYYSSVQFYLHFQFNGWFIFAIIGLFLHHLEINQIELPRKLLSSFLLLTASCLLTYALAVTWTTPIPALFFINSLGVTIQFAALVFFIKFIRLNYHAIRPLFRHNTWLLMKIAFISFVLKILVQSAVVIPYIATIGYTIRNYVIGFLHLMLLGMVTHFLLGLAGNKELMRPDTKKAKTGLGLLMAGFILSESLLVIQGTLFWAAWGFIPCYYEMLSFVSALIPLGIFLLLISQTGEKTETAGTHTR